MAESLVSSVLGQLATLTSESVRQELKLVIGVEDEVQTVLRNFRDIKHLLEDAEERQIEESSVKNWLDKLKDVSYDMEDVFDEWRTALSVLQTEGVQSASIPRKMVCPFTACFSFGRQIVRRHDIGAKIMEINQELDYIARNKDRYGFTKRKNTNPRPSASTTSHFIESEIKGRNDVRDKLVRELTQIQTGEEACIQTISVIGMGGIGKTTLAQMVFNHFRDRADFNKTIWVCVSNFFDQTKVARDILEGLGCDCQRLTSPESLLNKIVETIKELKLFIVLDDVWIEHDKDWEPLRAALQNCKKGSWILVTTRKESVVQVMRSSRDFHLEKLNDEDCWEILQLVAFFGWEQDECRDLKDVGEEIARKCKGLPLAAKALGSLLRHKRSRQEWEKVLHSKFWELKIAEDYIFKPLLLSYYDLPSPVRRCLSYCAIFPKDYVMSRDRLILHWKFQGLLNPKDDSDMMLEGGEYFDYLAGRSFFQNIEMDTSFDTYRCKMHDLVHDFLLFMTKDEIVEKEGKFDAPLRLDSTFRMPRHARITIGQEEAFHKSINGVEKLRTLFTFGGQYRVNKECLKKLFNEAKCLRLLEFESAAECAEICVNYGIEIPAEIGNLIQLRYLRIRCNYDVILPDSVCDLQNLEYLSLIRCTQIPDGVEKLINLKYLDISEIGGLHCLPKGIGKLTGLRGFPNIVARVDCNHPTEFSVGDLENLNELRGEINLYLTENDSINSDEVKRAKLHNKIHLSHLHVRTGWKGGRKFDLFVRAVRPLPNFPITR